MGTRPKGPTNETLDNSVAANYICSKKQQKYGGGAMANPLRLNPELVSAAERAGLVQKRSVPKQIEFWATLGKAVENVIDYSDIFAILQGLKKINIEPITSVTANPEEVFAALEKHRARGDLGEKTTKAVIYYEASRSHPGLIDRVNRATGERVTGRFSNGEFKAVRE